MTPEEWDAMTDEEQLADLQRALTGIQEEIREETKRSRFRDRWSRRKIHPVQNDINKLVGFVINRRMRQPGVTDLLRRVLHRVDTEAIRFLVEMVLQTGSCGWFMSRRCKRLLEYCDTIEAALAQRKERVIDLGSGIWNRESCKGRHDG